MKKFTYICVLALMSVTAMAAEKADLSSLFGKSDDFLEVDEAFPISVEVFDNELIATWKIAPTYYLYQHRLKAQLKSAEIGQVFMPEGKHKVDEYFGDVQIYTKQLQLSIPFKTTNTSFAAELEFQGCAEAGLCYPPTSRYFKIDITSKTARLMESSDYDSFSGNKSQQWSAPAKEPQFGKKENGEKGTSASQKKSTSINSGPASTQINDSQSDKKEFVSEKDVILNTLNDSSVIVAFFTLIILGVGLAFTPCVFPMMPIISSIIAGQGKDITTSKAFLLSLVYTQAMAIPYIIIGIIVAGAGAGATSALQSPIAVSIAAVIFLILSLGMFGFFEIQLPSSLQNKLNAVSQKQQSGSYLGAAIMGAISGAVVSPCVTIPLIAVLTWISTVGDAFTGGIYLYGLALGMGIPLIMIGVGGGKVLPRAGAWMNAVKSAFGVIMIGVALYITKHLIPGQLNLVLWGILFTVCGIYMGALKQVESGWPTFWKGIGVVLLIYGGTLIIGAAKGNTSIFKPLSNSTSSHSITQSNESTPQNKEYVDHAGFTLIKTSADLDRYLAQAKAENKTVMLDFFAEYCTACYEFAELTFPDPKVQAALSNTILLQADVTAGDDADKELMDRFTIFGLPSILFFDKEGNEVSGLRAEGFEDAETFTARIDAAIGD
ncbi:protein-disulfide reductase DsbD [Pleionea sediminis]|uniref:protein-disulfide reductase DsbD n=1 Tax=Pleionea sediminis TaxID=2569479 RepID=UPI001185CCD6|nr:protein-disulfide reductase DsbD [Pleionea sediminis]